MANAIELKRIETGFLVKEINWNQANKYYGCDTLQSAIKKIEELFKNQASGKIIRDDFLLNMDEGEGQP